MNYHPQRRLTVLPARKRSTESPGATAYATHAFPRIELMIAAASSRWAMAQRHYKRNVDRTVLQEPIFRIGDCAFVFQTHLGTIASGAADETANNRYNKLLWRVPEPYKVLSVHLHTVSVEQEWITKTVSIDHLTLYRTRPELTVNIQGLTESKWPGLRIQQQRNAVEDTLKVIRCDATVPQEYLASPIMRQMDTPKKEEMWKYCTYMAQG